MTTRIPLVLISGIPQELPATDTVVPGPTVMAFRQADGTTVWLPLTVLEEELPPAPAVTADSPTKLFFMAGW